MTPASMEDWFRVNELFTRYATALDRGEVEAVVDCFTADATLTSPVLGTFSGPAGIRDFAARTAHLKAEHGAQFRHVLSNLQVEVDGDRARATCYLLDFITRDGTTELLSPGEYECALRRAHGAWRFESRLVRMDRPFAVQNMTDKEAAAC
jgi:ketosteroid isomerase-like protein